MSKQRNGDIRLLILPFTSIRICRLASYRANIVLSQFPVFLPSESYFRRRLRGGGIALSAVYRRDGRLTETLLWHLKFPRGRCVPSARFHLEFYLLVRVVELYDELCRKKGLRRGRDTSVKADFLFRWRRLTPIWDKQDLPKQNVWVVAIIQGCSVPILGGGQRGVWMSKRIFRHSVGAMVREEK